MEARLPTQLGIEISVAGSDGTVLQQAQGPVFRGVVPTTQDYILTLHNYGGLTSYMMTVIIPVRITFAPGDTGTTLQGSLHPNEIDHYVIRALQGQTMVINTPTTSGQVALSVVGVDGTILQNQITGSQAGDGFDFSAVLPKTQDYLIEVQAGEGTAVTYMLDIAVVK
ncbi:MAG: hypothetical protein P1S60_16305, partial [Anaerolineae bacterium]|nr:hypothetical protein [Anaerolineae bacterium]